MLLVPLRAEFWLFTANRVAFRHGDIMSYIWKSIEDMIVSNVNTEQDRVTY